MTMARSAIKILRRFYIFMRRTTISHFSFLIQARLSNVIMGITPLYISIAICYNVPIYGDEEEEYVRQSEPAVVRGRRWTEGVSELFPEQSREIREIKVGLKEYRSNQTLRLNQCFLRSMRVEPRVNDPCNSSL